MVTRTVTGPVITLLALSAGSITVVTPLRSQTRISVTPYVGAYFADDAAVFERPQQIAPDGGESLDASTIAGVRVEIPLHNNLNLEGSYGFTTVDARREVEGTSSVFDEHTSHIYGIALQVLLTPHQVVTPFLTGGIGAVRVASSVPDPPASEDQLTIAASPVPPPEDEAGTDVVTTVGAGIQSRLSGRFGIRADARALIQFCNEVRFCPRDDQALKNVELSVGVRVGL